MGVEVAVGGDDDAQVGLGVDRGDELVARGQGVRVEPRLRRTLLDEDGPGSGGGGDGGRVVGLVVGRGRNRDAAVGDGRGRGRVAARPPGAARSDAQQDAVGSAQVVRRLCAKQDQRGALGGVELHAHRVEARAERLDAGDDRGARLAEDRSVVGKEQTARAILEPRDHDAGDAVEEVVDCCVEEQRRLGESLADAPANGERSGESTGELDREVEIASPPGERI